MAKVANARAGVLARRIVNITHDRIVRLVEQLSAGVATSVPCGCPMPRESDGDPMMAETGRILVVDDTPQNVKLLADLLGVKGYAVSTASNGEEALAKIAAEPPDLVLLDVMMAGCSGEDAF